MTAGLRPITESTSSLKAKIKSPMMSLTSLSSWFMSNYWQIPLYTRSMLSSYGLWHLQCISCNSLRTRLYMDGGCYVWPQRCLTYSYAHRPQRPLSSAYSWHSKWEVQALLLPFVGCISLRRHWHSKPFYHTFWTHSLFYILITNDRIWHFSRISLNCASRLTRSTTNSKIFLCSMCVIGPNNPSEAMTFQFSVNAIWSNFWMEKNWTYRGRTSHI